MFIENQDSNLVRKKESGDLAYIKTKVKKVRFQDKKWIRSKEEDNIVIFCQELINSNKRKLKEYITIQKNNDTINNNINNK